MTATLQSDIQLNGVTQGDLVRFMQNVRDLVNELQTDHATNKTTIDESRTAILELITDHATFKTVVDDTKALLNQLRTSRLYGAYGNPGFVIDTNYDVKNGTAFYYTNGGILKTLAANVNFNTGTAKTITASKWSAALLSVDASGNGVVTWASGGAYNDEATAIAALPAPAATETAVGYVTVLAHASGYTAGTDALQGGTGGNVATTTTYYNAVNPNAMVFGAAVSSSAPATLTAGNPTASAASLTASTALTLAKG